MTLFLAHVPPAGFPHYGLDKAGGLFWVCYVTVVVSRATCSPSIRANYENVNHVLTQQQRAYLA